MTKSIAPPPPAAHLHMVEKPMAVYADHRIGPSPSFAIDRTRAEAELRR
ncbi:MAG: hypothetical protein OXI81_03490 [Paracoccaceae bacterium]|nr:hypothetical protein [Paracoccaceae bacterium]